MALIVFCHGIPGGPADAQILRDGHPNADIAALEPLTGDPATWDADVLADFDRLVQRAGGGPVHLVGFSIGAMIAISLAARRPQQVSQLTLVSAAGPLSLGDFLPDMAGRPIFEMAQKTPRLLRVVTAFQGMLARFLPGLLIRTLFSKCGATERAYLGDAGFRKIVIDGLRGSLSDHPRTYCAIVQRYVHDWQRDVDAVSCPVTLWHGTADTWAPLAMAEALGDRLGPNATRHWVEGGEHYSTLKAARL